MTAPAGTVRPSVLVTLRAVVLYTLRSCIGPKRWLGCLLPCAGALLFGLVARTLDNTPAVDFAQVGADGIFALVVPVVALVIGDAVLGAEVRSGVFHFTWLTPARLEVIVVGRWLGGCLAALVTVVPASAAAAVIAGAPESATAMAIGVAAGSMAYLAVFIAIGCVARRAAVWSLAYVFMVERLLGTALTGIAQWSPMWEARALFLDLAPDVPDSLVREGIPAGGAALVRLAVVSAVALGLARWRLAHLKLTGASD